MLYSGFEILLTGDLVYEIAVYSFPSCPLTLLTSQLSRKRLLSWLHAEKITTTISSLKHHG